MEANKKDSTGIHPVDKFKVKGLAENDIDQVLDTLMKLQIVKEATRIIDSASMGTRQIAFMPDSIPHPNGELYIAAGDNRPERFETFFNFFVDINTMYIRIYDVMKEDTIGVKEYESRRTRND